MELSLEEFLGQWWNCSVVQVLIQWWVSTIMKESFFFSFFFICDHISSSLQGMCRAAKSCSIEEFFKRYYLVVLTIVRTLTLMSDLNFFWGRVGMEFFIIIGLTEPIKRLAMSWPQSKLTWNSVHTRVVQIMYCPLKLKNWWQPQNFLII